MLKPQRVKLTPLRADDLPAMFEWINDRELVLRNSGYRLVGEAQHRAWFESVQQRADTVIFAIRLAEDDRLIGSCQLHGISHVHRAAELQIRIGTPALRGKGHGTDAVRLLLDFAFRDLNLRRVYLHVFCDNAAAVRVYEKAGFVREGLLRGAAYVDGKYLDVLVMAILREEYDRQ